MRRDRIRTYCGYVGRLLIDADGLQCASNEDLARLTRSDVMRAMHRQHRRSAHTLRLCRIAWNRGR